MTYAFSTKDKYAELFDDDYRSSAMAKATFGAGSRNNRATSKRLRVIAHKMAGSARIFLHRVFQVIAESKMKRVERELRFHNRRYNRKED